MDGASNEALEGKLESIMWILHPLEASRNESFSNFHLLDNGKNTFGLKLNPAASFNHVLQLQLKVQNVFRLNKNRLKCIASFTMKWRSRERWEVSRLFRTLSGLRGRKGCA
jgi:hypothetical protein